MKERYYSFNRYLQGKFGQRVQRISIDAGFTCPNLEEACIYCNNKAFSPYVGTAKTIKEQIEKSLEFYRKRGKVNKFIAYFQAFTNTYEKADILKKKYDLIKEFPEIVGLFISTRPDCVDEEKIKLISNYQKDYLVWIEYGLQTTNNRILKRINRRHSYEDFLEALELTRKYGINVGAHIILGLPWANYKDMTEDAEKLSGLDIQGLKFHILHVLKNTKLEELFKKGKIKTLSQEEYIRFISDFLERIPPNIVILRLVSEALKDCLVSPLWMNHKSQVLLDIRKELKRRNSYQGVLYESTCCQN
jgi:radical SAM protein (TIGR01212 family)